MKIQADCYKLLSQERVSGIGIIFEGLHFSFRNSRPGPSCRKLAALVTPGHYQYLTTRGTRGVGGKPGVYTTHMEPMATLGQYPDLIPLRELP